MTKRRFFTVALMAAGICAVIAHGPVSVATTDSDVVLLKRVRPVFPMAAFADCIAGRTVVEFTVDVSGNVVNVTAIRSKPTGVFDDAAIVAVRKWKFLPRILHGAAVPRQVQQQIDFEIASDCEPDMALPDIDEATESFNEVEARRRCLDSGGKAWGFAELSFRIAQSGAPADVTVVRATSGRFAHQARVKLAGRSFAIKYSGRVFEHVFEFCVEP